MIVRFIGATSSFRNLAVWFVMIPEHVEHIARCDATEEVQSMDEVAVEHTPLARQPAQTGRVRTPGPPTSFS